MVVSYVSVVVLEGIGDGEHDEKYDAEGPDIDAVIVTLLSEDFRGDVR